MEKEIWIESFDYFKAGNRFAGSSGLFCFKIFPEKAEERLRVAIWQGPNCCEKTEQKEERDFEFSEGGLQQAVEWIQEQNRRFQAQRGG